MRVPAATATANTGRISGWRMVGARNGRETMRQKVKILMAVDCSELEDKINAFAERHEIENVSISVRNHNVGFYHYACVVYREGK